ncbi:peptidase family m28 family [Lasallia pustulata]|uniref:Peptide hydrolase n=1 Tax=Lasallia pustulata TaxID=136370 RepID=A0A1W5CWW8_9LECA|nr:peptidase family m28 family [Lasallia pustulata]
MKKTSRNPVAFTPLPVTIITSLVYAALIVALLITHLIVPPTPNSPTPVIGINLAEAWQDLQTLSNGFHPYNSRRNDVVRNWLLTRIEAIMQDNDVAHSSQNRRNTMGLVPHLHPTVSNSTPVVVFNDMMSNLSFSTDGIFSTSGRGKEPGTSTYFEGTNIIVYIRGSEDENGNWWRSNGNSRGKGGVLVNAHYDSVSTGYGATDDGVGVVSVLQLIRHFTTPGQKPKKGIVALLNNGEEDGLHGAFVFSQHPLSRFAHTFLNLEGAGAGGRATLFRSTDTEVTRFYQRSKYPFGTVVSGDGFKRGFVRSQTDYVVFNGLLGLRGLDVAFMEPRARYHTDQDDTRHTSRDSLWHMLSAALSTMQGLTSDTSSTFEGGSPDKGKVPNGKGTDAVWFDMFGHALAVFRLRTFFALSVTLLAAAPIILIIIGAILIQVDKLYLFSSSKHHHHAEGDDTISLQGWRGFFRYPIIFFVASAANVGLAFLLTKVNPYIVYSSQYAVWSMMLSAWLFVAWFLSRAADFVRPSALHRAYAHLWMFAGGWLVLVAVAVLEDRFKIGGAYFMVFYFAAIFMSTMIAFLELFGLPRKSNYADAVEDHGERTQASIRSNSISSGRMLAQPADEQHSESVEGDGDPEEEATESTSLLRNDRQTTFAHYTLPHQAAGDDEVQDDLSEQKQNRVFGDEQAWSWSLPTWTWLLQFLLVAPIMVILLGQIGLLLTSATYQTLSDGNSVLAVYMIIAVFTILVLAPLGPFLHRYTYHIPTFLLLVLAGTLIYNLIAFPFSPANRLKLYFIQTVDLDTGINEVSLTGIGDPYLMETINDLPSSAGRQIKCAPSSTGKAGLTKCAWEGLPPRVVPHTHPEVPPLYGYSQWLSFNVSREAGKNEASFHLSGRNTRACKIVFNNPISDFSVHGAGEDSRLKRVSEEGSKEIRLWSRTWEKPWDVKVSWGVSEGKQAGEEGLDGRVVCLWSDENETGLIPALDEMRLFAPEWVAITKGDAGLVEGSKAFLV